MRPGFTGTNASFHATTLRPALAHLTAFRTPSGVASRYRTAWLFLTQRNGEVTRWKPCWCVPMLLFSSLPKEPDRLGIYARVCPGLHLQGPVRPLLVISPADVRLRWVSC